jgi:hypothetical protein
MNNLLRTHGGVAPMTKILSEQRIEKIVGDMDKAGQPFVIRIHHDAWLRRSATQASGRRKHHQKNLLIRRRSRRVHPM